MKDALITMPELALIAGTRGILGAGIGLLVASKLTDDQRMTLGRALFAIGALTTIPLALEVFGKRRDRKELHAADPAVAYGT